MLAFNELITNLEYTSLTFIKKKYNCKFEIDISMNGFEKQSVKDIDAQ